MLVSENQSAHTALGEENSPGFRNQVSDVPLYLTLRFISSSPIITQFQNRNLRGSWLAQWEELVIRVLRL